MPGVNDRQYRFRFREPLSTNVAARIRDRLLDNDHINQVEHRDNFLLVDYRFPLVTLETIAGTIRHCAGGDLYPASQRLALLILSMKESNETDYLSNRFGWQRYIEDIYMHEYQTAMRQRTDVRLQTWRKYKYT